MVRLRDVLPLMRIPVDVLATSVEKIREWGHLPGTVLYEALHEGKIVYESSWMHPHEIIWSMWHVHDVSTAVDLDAHCADISDVGMQIIHCRFH